MGQAFFTYLGSEVKVNFFHAGYDNFTQPVNSREKNFRRVCDLDPRNDLWLPDYCGLALMPVVIRKDHGQILIKSAQHSLKLKVHPKSVK